MKFFILKFCVNSAVTTRVSKSKGELNDQDRLPIVAIVGRPNVGKSTLFNRLTGTRRAIVGDEPGITRDRLYGRIEWIGREMRVIDTGGIIPDDKALIPSEIFRQARVALDEAAAIMMVVDGRTELASPDMELARLLLRLGKPLFLAVNKIDAPKLESYVAEYRRLGIRNVFGISAEHGVNIAELIEAVMDAADAPEIKSFTTTNAEDTGESQAEPEQGRSAKTKFAKQPEEVSVAIIGRPNVGKSTLLNRLTGASRAIVSPIAGTTRDAVDEIVERAGKRWRFIDTAGIRRKGKTELMAEKLSVIMARKHLEAADIALLMVDATEGVTASDATIGGYAHESGRSVIIVINKWDLVTVARENKTKPAADRDIFEEQARRALKYLSYAPMIFISAETGRNTEKIFDLAQQVASERWKRISTGEMNRFLKRVDFERASVPASKRVRVYYMTQAAVAPPTFILFTDRSMKLHFSYARFLENQIRRAFAFTGTPIWFKVRES